MENKLAISNQKLPTLSQIYSDNSEKLFKNDQFLRIMNSYPKPEWVKEHPFIKGHKYISIEKIEIMLQQIFKQVKIEVLKTGMLLNAIEVTVRVHVVHPVTNEWTYHDGVGACEVQTVSGSGSLKLDMSNINRGAVSMALPIAKSYAIKDACDHFGRLFGRDINRKDLIEYKTDENISEKYNKTEKLRVEKFIHDSTKIEQLRSIDSDVIARYDLMELYEEKFALLTEKEM